MQLSAVMERIRDASPDSPIAVFRVAKRGYFETMFANTIITRQLIESGNRKFIGAYHGAMDCAEIHKRLSLCARGRA